MSKLTGLSAGQTPTDSPTRSIKKSEKSESAEKSESTEKSESAEKSEAADEPPNSPGAVGPITSKEDFSLETRPFLTMIFDVLNCSENDYLVLFSVCLLRAIQRNEGMITLKILDSASTFELEYNFVH